MKRGKCDSESNRNWILRVGFGMCNGGSLKTPASRVLVVEDSEPFRKFICSTLGKRPELQIVASISDGLMGVQQALELHPDLILLDIGLPSLNGIEAARRIRKLSPGSKILFLSQESSLEVVRECIGTGAQGYVVKTDAGGELLDAVNTVLRGNQFVGRRFAGHDFIGASDEVTSQEFRSNTAVAPLQGNMKTVHRHEVRFYSEDGSFLESFTQFIGAALNGGNAVIVVATESHRDSLLLRLQAHGVDISAAVEQGRYISLDAAEAVASVMTNDLPDPGKFAKVTADLVAQAAKAVTVEHGCVAACGECAPLLCSQGKTEAAIRLEHLWDDLAKSHGLDVLCAYPLGRFQGGVDSHIFERICAEHSVVHFR